MARSAFAPFLALLAFTLALVGSGCIDDSSPTPVLDFDAGVVPGFEAGLPTPTPEASTADAEITPPDTTLTSTPTPLSNQAQASFEFSSTKPGARFACRLDDAAPAECTSPHTVTVGEGAHTFEVTAISPEGVPDASPAKFAWNVDLTAPDVTISNAPAALDNSTTVTFEFGAGENVTFECALDGAPAAPCTSPHAITGLADGPHTLTITATDEAGNADPTPATHTWTVDTTAPDTQILTGPTGNVSSTSASFTFTSANAGPGATFACSLDGGAYTTCTSPRALTGLAQGAHTFRVRVTDATGNTDPTPAARSWTVDTVAPVVAVTGGPTGPTNDQTPTFTFTTSGATLVDCRILPGGAFAACTSPFTSPAALGTGSYTFEVRGRDAAGNAASATRAFSIDITAPTLTITGGPSGPTNDTTPSFTFTATGATAIDCRVLPSGAFAPCTSPFTSSALTTGSYTFEVRARDAASNVSTATRAFSIDVTPPVVSITGGPAGPTNDTTPTFTFTVTGATAIACRVMPGGAFAPCTSPFTSGALATGSYTFEVRGTDAATNSATATRAFSIDVTPPTISITAGPTGATNDSTPTFSFTATGATGTQCRILPGGTFAACTSPFTTTALADGAYTFEVRAFDAASNAAVASRAFSVDTVPPAVAVTAGPTSTPLSQETFTFTSEAGSTTTCRIYPRGQPGGGYVACTSPDTENMPFNGPSSDWTYEVRAADAAGNAGLATWDFNTYIIP